MTSKLWHGAAFYPGLWPGKTIDEDIRMMSDLGLNIVRMGEFGVVTKRHARVGLVETDSARRHAATIVLFNRQQNSGLLAKFTAAKQFTFTVQLMGVTNPDATLPKLQVEFLGTFLSSDD